VRGAGHLPPPFSSTARFGSLLHGHRVLDVGRAEELDEGRGLRSSMGEYDLTLGPVLLGAMLNMFLYGIVTSQAIRYVRVMRRIDESRMFRFLFISVFFVDTTYTVITIYLLWFFSVARRGDPASFLLSLWPLQITPISLAWPAFVTHLYLTRRLWRLVQSKLLVIISTLLATCSLLLAVSMTAKFCLEKV